MNGSVINIDFSTYIGKYPCFREIHTDLFRGNGVSSQQPALKKKIMVTVVSVYVNVFVMLREREGRKVLMKQMK